MTDPDYGASDIDDFERKPKKKVKIKVPRPVKTPPTKLPKGTPEELAQCEIPTHEFRESQGRYCEQLCFRFLVIADEARDRRSASIASRMADAYMNLFKQWSPKVNVISIFWDSLDWRLDGLEQAHAEFVKAPKALTGEFNLEGWKAELEFLWVEVGAREKLLPTVWSYDVDPWKTKWPKSLRWERDKLQRELTSLDRRISSASENAEDRAARDAEAKAAREAKKTKNRAEHKRTQAARDRKRRGK